MELAGIATLGKTPKETVLSVTMTFKLTKVIIR